jgi:hypothetical protein
MCLSTHHFLYAEVHRKGMQLHAACLAAPEHVAQKWEPVLREKHA